MIAGPPLVAALRAWGGPLSGSPDIAWTGFHAGVNVGYAWSGAQTIGGYDPTNAIVGTGLAALPPPNAYTLSIAGVRGFMSGGQFGYSQQIVGRLVAGLETDLQGMIGLGAKAHLSELQGFTRAPGIFYGNEIFVRKQMDFLGTTRARFGFLATPALLAYATGGLAYGDGRLKAIIAAYQGSTWVPPTLSSGSARVGWTVGGGVEWQFVRGWSAKAEYLHYDLGRATTTSVLRQYDVSGALVSTSFSRTSARFNGDLVRFGANYRFAASDLPFLH
ncbi:MAG: porin family protein [Hyphomicrobiales bacterium]|nr:porin family protein [Hyphomicrobiales bacterium]